MNLDIFYEIFNNAGYSWNENQRILFKIRLEMKKANEEEAVTALKKWLLFKSLRKTEPTPEKLMELISTNKIQHRKEDFTEFYNRAASSHKSKINFVLGMIGKKSFSEIPCLSQKILLQITQNNFDYVIASEVFDNKDSLAVCCGKYMTKKGIA